MSIWATLVTAELLPLGMWLVIFSSVHSTLRHRVLLSGGIAFVISTVSVIALGDRLSFFQVPAQYLGPINFDVAGWVFELALIQLAAVGAAVIMACYGPVWTQLPVMLMLCILTAPLAVQWFWKDGWLTGLGRTLNLGHGAIDFGGVSMIGVLIGLVALGVMLFLPRRTVRHRAPVSEGRGLWALGGALALALGAGTIFWHPITGELGDITQAYQLRFGLASLVATVFVLIYGVFVTGKVNWVWQARAVLASILICSAGAVTLPIWLVVGLGIACGLLVTVGDYLVNEHFYLHDETAALAGILAPSLLGLLIIGLFANGEYGIGLNGIGLESYLHVPQLGVVGLWSRSADPGQLSAQLMAVAGLGSLAALTTLPLIWLVRSRLAVPTFAILSDATVASATVDLATVNPSRASEPTTTPAFGPAPVVEIGTADVLPDALMPQWPGSMPLAEGSLPTTKTELAESYMIQPEIRPTGNSTYVGHGHDEATPQSERSVNILERLRQANQRNRPEHPPLRAARVAYPTRVAGKRLIRPVVEEKPPADKNLPADKSL